MCEKERVCVRREYERGVSERRENVCECRKDMRRKSVRGETE